MMDTKNLTPDAPGDKPKTQLGPEAVKAITAHNQGRRRLVVESPDMTTRKGT